jgi:predicted NAD/FAD-binding protein
MYFHTQSVAQDGRAHNRLRIAIVGSGISGLSAAWLLSQCHDVVVYEKEDRLGGHSNTVLVPSANGSRNGEIAVDTGFIVYNERNYPNLTALFHHLGVPTRPSEMSLAVSLDGGALEYSGTGIASLFAQKRNLASPRFWRMLGDIARFYREAPLVTAARTPTENMTLGRYVDERGYGKAFIEDHLLPMAAAIWSAPVETVRDLPLVSFVRFCENHGLLRISGRPQWRTVIGGSVEYVQRLSASFENSVRLNCLIRKIRRGLNGAVIEDMNGDCERFDHVIVATHADQALALLEDPDAEEQRLLGAFRYQRNLAVLHNDESLMPKRRAAWSSWNYLGERAAGGRSLSVTYWMNRLQAIDETTPLFVTLNPAHPPRPGSIIRSFFYDHPILDVAAIEAQKSLWVLQGARNTWFCGAHFGAGFHEDGLQAGLAVAEALGNVRRPWSVEGESGRIHVGPVASISAAGGV